MKLDAVYIVVTDMSEAKDFYARLFDRAPSIEDDRFSGFDLDGGLFGLLSVNSYGETVDTRPLTYGTNCVANIRVDDVASLRERVKRLDPPHLTEVQDTGAYRLFQVEDPDGNRVEFYEPVA